MKNIIIILLSFILFSCQEDYMEFSPIENDYKSIKVMSFNIRHSTDLNKISDMIIDNNIDLVALQEIDINCERSGYINIIQELAEKTGMDYYFSKTVDMNPGEYGVGVLSKYSILSSETIKLYKPNNTEQRVVSSVIVNINNKEIRFASTHFDWSSIECRNKQAENLNLNFVDDIPTIIAGDLNAEPNEECFSILREEWQIPNHPFDTHPAKNPKRQIDHIIYRGGFNMNSIEVIKDKKISDHRPIIMSLEL